MTATIVSGKYFGGSEQVTDSKLHAIVESATFSNIGLSELAADAGAIQVSPTSPSDTTRPWYDTTIGITRIYDGTNWTAPNCIVLTNGGAAVVAGDIVCVDTGANNSFVVTTTEDNPRVLGVAREAIAGAATGLIQTSGVCTVNLRSDTYTAAKIYLATSTTSAKAKLSTNTDPGRCGTWLFKPAASATTATVLLWGGPAI